MADTFGQHTAVDPIAGISRVTRLGQPAIAILALSVFGLQAISHWFSSNQQEED